MATNDALMARAEFEALPESERREIVELWWENQKRILPQEKDSSHKLFTFL